MMTEAEVRGSVKRAAELFDALVPGWHRRLNPEKLNMGSCSLCAAGQLFGHDVETSIAKEMWPKEWEEARRKVSHDQRGYRIALFGGGMLRSLLMRKRLPSEASDDLSALSTACGGSEVLRCMWIEETAERIEKEEERSA